VRDRLRLPADPRGLSRGDVRRRRLGPCKTMKLLVNTCTVGVPFVKEIEQQAAAQGVTLVDCPISGGPPGARAGTLSVMISGDPASIERVRPMISLWGRTLTVAGDKPGAAQVLKLTNNILSAVALAATSEAFVMGAKGGLDPEVMLAAINAGSGQNSATQAKFPHSVLTRSFDFGAEMHILRGTRGPDVGLSGCAVGVQARHAEGCRQRGSDRHHQIRGA
jgi:3-hydroxyisobutyrate dehydrogenase-like beta-hydroxyacid dehydrogenase